MNELFTRHKEFAALSLSLAFFTVATPADVGAHLITDEQGYLVCHLCGPDKADSYLMADNC